MSFNSWPYFILLLLTVVLNYFTKNKNRIVLFNFSSFVFYCFWDFRFFLLLVFLTIFLKVYSLLNYSRFLSVIFIIIILLPLLLFKYLPWIGLITGSSNLKNIIFPIGISFYTFQSISFIVDFDRNKIIRSDVKVSNLLFFLSFFPKILSGPIEKYNYLCSQIKNYSLPNIFNINKGIVLIFIGLIKKMIVADKLSMITDTFYSNVNKYDFYSSITSLFFYSWQLYLDFSGYIDIALGSSILLGIKLSENFNTPYLSTSLKSFWQRWNITLHIWFVDYIYKGLLKKTKNNYSLVILLVFLISGFWHGASVTFLYWAILHFVFYQFSVKIKSPIRVNNIIKTIITFTIVCLLWVPFRSENTLTILNVFKNLFMLNKNSNYTVSDLFINSGWSDIQLIMYCILSLIFVVFEQTKLKSIYIDSFCNSKIKPLNTIFTIVFLIILIFFGEIGSRTFYYFQF